MAKENKGQKGQKMEAQAENKLSDKELAEKLANGELSYGDVSEDDFKRIMTEGYEDEEQKGTEEVRPDEKAQVVEQTTEETEQVDPVSDLKKKLFEKSNELNKYKQKSENLEDRLVNDPAYREKFFKEKGIEISNQNKEIADEDLLDDENLKSLYKTVNDLKSELNSTKSELTQYKSHIETVKQQEQVNGVFSEVENLQNTYSQLKTTIPVKKLDSIINDIASKNGGARVTLEQAQQAGVTPEDFNNYNDLLNAHQIYRNEGHPNLAAAFRNTERYIDILHGIKNASNNAKVENAKIQAADAKQNEVSQQTKILGTTSAEGLDNPTGMTQDFIQKFLADNPDPIKIASNPEKYAVWKKCMEACGIPVD